MSILEVKNLSHGFGDRAIFEDVSFRLLKGEHIGLVGANGEGKSTFMSIVTGKMLPDEGKVEWSKYVTAGYLDQHAVLKEGQTVRGGVGCRRGAVPHRLGHAVHRCEDLAPGSAAAGSARAPGSRGEHAQPARRRGLRRLHEHR